MIHEWIDGALFAEMVRAGTAELNEHRPEINDLNVFPIPDGDTGDNMYMTIQSGLNRLSAQPHAAVGEAAASLSDGMLFGARGNSGVILSRIFHGFARGLNGVERAGISALCDALRAGSEEAYSAVSNPVEGTILSVFRDAANYAETRSDETGSSVEGFFGNLLAGMKESLARTPELLDVLAEAGVVDSGGAGLVCITEGMLDALQGRAELSSLRPEPSPAQSDPLMLDRFTEDSALVFGYCTEFLLRLQRRKTDPETFDTDALVSGLSRFGDSIVAFRDGSIVKVHIHTFTPGDVLNYCQRYGEYLTLKIENMTLQHHESHPEAPADADADFLQKKPRKPYGIVAVASGKGIREMFSSLGCDRVIEGGQSMNPEVEDFIRAFSEINAQTILVYPNNGNVQMAARQAAELYHAADILVVPTRTVGEGYAAISMLDTASGDPEAILADQKALIASVKTGFVSRAVRDTALGGIGIRKDDYIGFSGDAILADGEGRENVLLALADRLEASRYDVMMIIFGENVEEQACATAADALRKKLPRTEIVTIDGGQPVHDYILVLE